MASSFRDLMAQRIHRRREEFIAGLSHEPDSEVEDLLSTSIQAHWHPFHPKDIGNAYERPSSIAAVDGSRAIRALNSGADWIIAQALLLGPHGYRLPAVDTRLLRGEIERPDVDRCASLLMRSLELDLALQFVNNGTGSMLILDGSLYADLPYLLYNLAINGYEDLPLMVLEQYLQLFELCQKRDVLLLGIAKSTRSAVLGRALLSANHLSMSSSLQRPDAFQMLEADVQKETPLSHAKNGYRQWHNKRSGMNGLPTDGELLHRWTKDVGLTDPVLLGSASFGHASAEMTTKLVSRAKQSLHEPHLLSNQPQMGEQLSSIHERLLDAPAIGTFYIRLAPGDDVLRVDALASTFGRNDLHLLEFTHTLVPATTALPLVKHLLGEYGGLSVYHAALYVVDQEVRLHAETVDQVYFSILRHQLGQSIQYDRSTRRFLH